jgi:replication initiation protein RepC
MKALPLAMVLEACPEIVNYAPAGTIDNCRKMMMAAAPVRSMLGISPSAYEDACDVMGQENVAVVVACILERAGEVNSAGGYLRDLTVWAKRGAFSLGPVLMALLRLNGQKGGGAA